MPLTLAFIDPTRLDYTPDTPRRRPLGGSQSALCYLAEGLAAAGCAVRLVNGTTTPGLVRGVACLNAEALSWDSLADCDVVVILNDVVPALVRAVRAALPARRKLVLWTQHAATEPMTQALSDPAVRSCFDAVVFVSRWQRDSHVAAFGLDRDRCRILRNAAAPAFDGLFAADADVAATKPWPPVLAYTSTPFRGLDVLLDALPQVRAAIPGTVLRVFSSLEPYQVAAGLDPYAALYRRCRETEGVDYVGAVAQPALAEALAGATALAYLNRFAETSCVAVMEAMAAGCLVVTSRLGALPETAAGFAHLVPVAADPQRHAIRYAERLVAVLQQGRADPAGLARRLRAQVDHAAQALTWPARIAAWHDWLQGLCALQRRPVTAASGDETATKPPPALAGDCVQAQAGMLDRLLALVNKAADSGRAADAAFQEEAWRLVAALDLSLRDEAMPEAMRSSNWARIRGVDAWLAYQAALPHMPPPQPAPPEGRRVYDCFQFFNELDMLELRLTELEGVVDRFVLVEAAATHAGERKPLHFADNRARFARWGDRILHVVVEHDPNALAWEREGLQREAIARGLAGCRPDDLILVSDVDEIPDPRVIARLRVAPDNKARLFVLEYLLHLYFLELRSPEPWRGAAAAPWELVRRIGPNRLRYLAKMKQGPVIGSAGWHLTWMGGADRYLAKMGAYAHREHAGGFAQDPAGNRERLERFFATGSGDAGAVPGLWTGMQRVNVDETFPETVRREPDRFRRLGWMIPSGKIVEPAAHPDVETDAEVAALRRALAGPGPALAERTRLAERLHELERLTESEAVLTELLALVPADWRALGNLGVVRMQLGREETGLAALRGAVALAPADGAMLANLGTALWRHGGHDEEARRILSRAVAVDPGAVGAWHSLAVALRGLHRLDEAVAAADTLLGIDPGHVKGHFLRASLRLLAGDLEGGFREYEWRRRLPGFAPPLDRVSTPYWDGGDPSGMTLLVHDEQGLGDSIQFVRYAPLLARRGARVILLCAPELVPLFDGLPGVADVVPRGRALPRHDAHVALLSLPLLLGTPSAVPVEVPYLKAQPARVASWAKRLGQHPGGLRVGVVWAGAAGFKDDRWRSPGLSAILPLADVPGVQLVALQKGDGRQDPLLLKGDLPSNFMDLGGEIGDFADTAAIMANLDLVISSCTAPVHLAGALGRPVWAILPSVCDWRWGNSGTDTVWYPTMQLFRQPQPGTWEPVVAAVKAALAASVP